MKIPLSWLKDYVNIGTMKPEDVAERLTVIGLEVVMIEKVAGDSVLDIEITPNRPDCLSVLGIAREVAASMNKKVKGPKIKAVEAKAKSKPVIEIKDKKLCPRYSGRIIHNVKVSDSPRWVTEKLERMDLRPVNNIVDITNYCLFELGQPTHAFDYDKLVGKITVRRAIKGEKIITIDGRERTLEPEMLIIADEEKPVALAGVMGSKDTEVTESTRNILFESAYFDPISVRKTSRRLGLISESSYRFERSVDIAGVIPASDRACNLIIELCGGEAGPITDVGARDPKKVKIYLRPEKLKSLLGIDISDAAIKKALASLGLDVELSGKGTMVVSIPTFRQDLKSEVDLIEEGIRVYGYDKLRSTMPTIVGHPKRIEESRELSNITRDALISLGMDEIITYSLISREDAKLIGEIDEEKTVVIKNPLSIEQEIMRPNLISGILHVVQYNINRGAKEIRMFEIGRAYEKSGKKFKEEDSLSLAFVGDKGGSWLGKTGLSFFDMKGVLESLFEKLGSEEILFKNEGFPDFLTGEAAAIEIGGEIVGYLGKAKKDLLSKFDIEVDVLISEISLNKLFKKVKLNKKFREIPKYPSAKRDVSIIIGKDVPHHSIVSAMREAGGDLVANIELFDQYFGSQVPQGSRSLSYSIEYRAYDRTLTDFEVNQLQTRVCDALVQKLKATIR